MPCLEIRANPREMLHTGLFLGSLCVGYTGYNDWRTLYFFVYLTLLLLTGEIIVRFGEIPIPIADPTPDCSEDESKEDEELPVCISSGSDEGSGKEDDEESQEAEESLHED